MLSAGMSADDLDALARASTTSSLDVAGRVACRCRCCHSPLLCAVFIPDDAAPPDARTSLETPGVICAGLWNLNAERWRRLGLLAMANDDSLLDTAEDDSSLSEFFVHKVSGEKLWEPPPAADADQYTLWCFDADTGELAQHARPPCFCRLRSSTQQTQAGTHNTHTDRHAATTAPDSTATTQRTRHMPCACLHACLLFCNRCRSLRLHCVCAARCGADRIRRYM